MPVDSAPTVDVKSLYAALDGARVQQGLSWRQLAKELGVSASTISRMANGLRPDVSAFATMTSWLRMPAEQFFVQPGERSEDEPELLAALAPLLRARRDLDEQDVVYLEELIGAAARRFRDEGKGQRR